MSGLTELGGILHEEHFRIVVWISELKNRVSGDAGEQPVFHEEDELGAMRELIAALGDFFHHHAFEEEALFPYLSQSGSEEIVEYLREEHATIEPIIEKLQSIARERLRRRAEDHRFWPHFRRIVEQLCAEVLDHLAREEEVVIQRLRDVLDAETDRRLVREHGVHSLHFGVC